MRNLLVLVLLAVAFVASASSLQAAPRFGSYAERTNDQLQQTRDGIDSLRHEVSNHETEILALQERIKNQEGTIDALREELSKKQSDAKERLAGDTASLQARLADLEKKSSDVVSDMGSLHKHAKATADLLDKYRDLMEGYQKRVATLEASLDQQAQNSRHVEGSVKALVDALQSQDVSVPKGAVSDAGGSSNSYKVAEGDSLGTIAKKHKTTIKALKEANGLDNDRIRIGQKLKIPQ